MTDIKEHAFYYCTGLIEIRYQGTMAQWNAVNIGEGWDDHSGAYAVYCTDGEIKK